MGIRIRMREEDGRLCGTRSSESPGEVSQRCLKPMDARGGSPYLLFDERKYSRTPKAHGDGGVVVVGGVSLIIAFGFESDDGSGGCAYQLVHTPTSTPPTLSHAGNAPRRP